MKNENVILTYLPQLNFLLSFLIVFHHGFTLPVDYAGGFSLELYGCTIAVERFMYNLSECAVPTFFFFSAYLFYRSFDGTWMQYIKKMKRRVLSLLIPYVIFCTIGYCKAEAFSSHGIGEDGISGYLESIWYSKTMPLWFVRELIIFSLLSPLIYKIKKSMLTIILVSLTSIILASLGIAKYQSFVYWFPVYLMGAAINKDAFTKLFSLYPKNKVKALSILSFLFYCIWAWFLPNGMAENSPLLRFEFILFRILTPMQLCYVLWLIMNADIEERRWMHYSFFVYCMHALVIALLKRLYDKLVGSYLDCELLKYFFIISTTYVGCVLIAIFLERYTPNLWKLLNGNR